MAPQICLYPNPETFEYIPLRSISDFADVIKCSVLRWKDTPGLFELTQ